MPEKTIDEIKEIIERLSGAYRYNLNVKQRHNKQLVNVWKEILCFYDLDVDPESMSGTQLKVARHFIVEHARAAFKGEEESLQLVFGSNEEEFTLWCKDAKLHPQHMQTLIALAIKGKVARPNRYCGTPSSRKSWKKACRKKAQLEFKFMTTVKKNKKCTRKLPRRTIAPPVEEQLAFGF